MYEKEGFVYEFHFFSFLSFYKQENEQQCLFRRYSLPAIDSTKQQIAYNSSMI